MITLDTSGLMALLNRRDSSHGPARQALREDPGPLFVPAGILAEVTYMIERILHTEILDAFLEDIESSAYRLDCGEDDIRRIRVLVRQYADLPLGFADAAVIACAERHGGRVLTLDWRHFGAVARAGIVRVVPA